MSKAKAPERWRNAIVRYGEAAPGQLLGHPLNPKTHPKQQQDALAGAISEVGWIAPVIVNEVTHHVIDGHARIGIAISRGEPTVPVAYVNLTEEAERLALATFDPIGNLAAMDNEHLAALLDGLTSVDDAVASLLRDLAPVKPKDLHPDDADLTPPVEPITKPGDLWLLGEHRLLCGDATKAEDVARLMAGAKAQMVLADPPYNVEYTGGSTNESERADSYADAMSDGQYTDWLTAVFRNAAQATDSSAAMHLWFASSKMRCVMDAFEGSGWQYRTLIVWNKLKAHYGALGAQYKHRYEPMFYCHKRGQSPRWFGSTDECTVWDEDQPRVNDLHPTMKPVPLYERSLRNHTAPDSIVLECFCGSGTTLVAAEQLSRVAYLIELSPAFVDVAMRRWERVTGGQAVKAHA